MGGSARLRSWFLRNFLEAAERELGAPAVAALPARVSLRVRPHLSLERLKGSAALDTIPLDEGEEALVIFDQTLGEGNGKLLERVACEMLARQLVQAVAAVRVGDLYGTVARLQGPLEHPFVDAALTFDLLRTTSGFTLTVGVHGRPRASRLLGHLATGAVLAAERFAREAHAEPLRVETEAFADRSRIEARFRRASSAPPPLLEPIPFSRRTSGAGRLTGTLSDEVNRILDRAPRRDSTPPPPESWPLSSRFPSEEPTLRRDGGPPRRPSSAPPPRPSSVPPPPRSSVAPPPDSAPPTRRCSAAPPAMAETPASPGARSDSQKPH